MEKKDQFIKLIRKYIDEGDIEKVEQILSEKKMEREQKIQILKALIEKGEYKVDPKKVAEKMIEFFKAEKED